MTAQRPLGAQPATDGAQHTQRDQEHNMESEGQPVAPPSLVSEAPQTSALAVDAFRKLKVQAASERGDMAPPDTAD